jgi:hypothetical protein
MSVNQNVKAAITALQHKRTLYDLSNSYYNGQHNLTFAGEKFRNAFGYLFRTLSVNVCPVVVDVVSDRLQIAGFTAAGNRSGGLSPSQAELIETKTQEIWRHNRMAKRAGDVHTEALKCGDSYIIIWPDNDNRAVIYPQQAKQIAVTYDPENPGYITQAAKWWMVTDEQGISQVRLNLYFTDRLEKYMTGNPNTYSSDLPFDAESFRLIDTIPNPYGKVPVFAFHNNEQIGTTGRSELADIIRLQDILNKIVADQLVAQEYNAYPQRYVTGLEVEYDDEGKPKSPFMSGADRLFAVTGENVKFGEFSTGDVNQFINAQNQVMNQISAVSGIPVHYFGLANGGYPSGESLKTAEHRLTSKVRDRQLSFGMVWEDAIRFCLEIEGYKNIEVDIQWNDTSPKNVAADLQNAVIKLNDLGIPLTQVQQELGYTAKQVESFAEENAETDEAALKAFNKGLAAEMDKAA